MTEQPIAEYGITPSCFQGLHDFCSYTGKPITRDSCPCNCHEPVAELDTNKEKETPVAPTTELEKYEDEAVEGEIVEAAEPLTKRAAQALDKKIRTASDKLVNNVNAFYELLEQAARGEIHVALGYSSWTAWMSDAVQFTPADRIERQELVKLMNGKGMSQRKIAGTLGVSQKTVDRDLEGVESEDSSVTTGTGSTYPKHPKAKTTEVETEIIDAEVVDDANAEAEAAPRTVNDVASEFREEIDALGIGVQAFKDILEYEEFPKAAKTVANRYLNRLGEHISELQKVVDCLMET